MQGVKRSFRAVGEGKVFERVCGRSKKSRYQVGYPTLGESSPTPVGSDKGHPRHFKGTTVTKRRGVLIMVPAKGCLGEQPSKKKLKFTQEPITFNDDDLEGAIQLHDNALVVAARINSFIMKRVLIDSGSGSEVMYPDLFKGLGLKNEDLSKYDTPLVRFDGRMAIPEGQISLPVSMEGKEVIVTFIVVASFSLYTTILGRP